MQKRNLLLQFRFWMDLISELTEGGPRCVKQAIYVFGEF